MDADPLIMVLNKNIEAAQNDEDPTMLRVFVHLSSRIQVRIHRIAP